MERLKASAIGLISWVSASAMSGFGCQNGSAPVALLAPLGLAILLSLAIGCYFGIETGIEVGAVVVLCVITYWYASATQRLLDLEEKRFRESRKPHIHIRALSGPSDDKRRLLILNVGEGPALELRLKLSHSDTHDLDLGMGLPLPQNCGVIADLYLVEQPGDEKRSIAVKVFMKTIDGEEVTADCEFKPEAFRKWTPDEWNSLKEQLRIRKQLSQ